MRKVASPLLRYQLEGVPNIYGLPVRHLPRGLRSLARRYVEAKAFTEANYMDAQHVAVAVLEGLEAIVSWNFKHIVRAWTIQKVNAVNQQLGLNLIVICSPWEVVKSDDA